MPPKQCDYLTYLRRRNKQQHKHTRTQTTEVLVLNNQINFNIAEFDERIQLKLAKITHEIQRNNFFSHIHL